jgi:hypothetical protein
MLGVVNNLGLFMPVSGQGAYPIRVEQSSAPHTTEPGLKKAWRCTRLQGGLLGGVQLFHS